MSMWLQPSLWLDTTGLCSAEGHRELVLDRERLARYAHKQVKAGFFANMMTALTLLGLVVGNTGPFQGPRVPPLIGKRFPKPPKSQDRHIVPVYMCRCHANPVGPVDFNNKLALFHEGGCLCMVSE